MPSSSRLHRSTPARAGWLAFIGRRRALLALGLLLGLVVPLQPPVTAPARLRTAPAPVANPVQLGTSFSPIRADWLGVDYQPAYDRLLTMHFRVIRLSAYWSEVDGSGYSRLDWLMERSAQAGQPVVLSVGMKAQGWPEFYLPSGYQPKVPEGGDLGTDAAVRDGALDFVQATVDRYRSSPVLVAWQVENEPFNPAGPHRWWIGRDVLDREVATVKARDERPVIVNAFGSFNMLFDRYSNRNGIDWRRLLGFESDTAENQSLQAIGPGDILGLDVYTRIGYTFLGRPSVATADADWAAKAGHWRRKALDQGKAAWLTEVQAEPWESSNQLLEDPKSTSARDIVGRVEALAAEGYTTMLLWGAEYWLWREAEGDPSWVEAVTALLAANSGSPSFLSIG